jgi:transposase InsO family protein
MAEQLQWGIKFRPNRPGAPHLNGKVERVQKTMLIEFYATANLDDPQLSLRLAEWQHFYNWFLYRTLADKSTGWNQKTGSK